MATHARPKLHRKNVTRNTLFWCLVTLCVVSFFLSLTFIAGHFSYKRRIAENTRNQAIFQTAKAAENVNAAFARHMSTANEIAKDLTEGRLSREEVMAKVRDKVNRNPHIHGIAIAYKPYAFSPGTRLHAPYYSRKLDKLQLIGVESLYDYTKPECDWFSLPLEQGASWIEPYFGQAGGALMTTYSVPFHKTDPATNSKVPIGVVALDISLDEVKKIVESIDLGSGGYGAVISKKGIYLYHPSYEFVRDRKTVREVAAKFNDRDRVLAAEKALTGERGLIDHKSVTTGYSSWLAFEPIPSTNWSLHGTFIKDDVPVDFDVMRRQLMRVVLASMIFFLSLLSLVLKIYQGDNGKLWKASAIGSAIFLAGIGLVWQLALSYDSDVQVKGTKIGARINLANFVHSYDRKSVDAQGTAPLYVPTGIFVHSMEFSGVNKLMVNGFIWQKYNDTFTGIERGFLLPDAVDEAAIKQVYSGKAGNATVIGWHFSATLYEHFDYSSYPVDHETIKIRIAPKDMGKNVVFIPDLDSYKLLSPGVLPGLDKEFVLPDWKIKGTFFELRSRAYNTNFGIKSHLGQDSFPMLYFNITIVRNLMDAFIRNMTPLIIVVLLLFAVMFISTEERMSKKFSMDIGENLVFVGSMFFVLVFTHISTRARIPTQEIFYLEYFYFTMYIALLWVPISSILFVTGSNMFYVQYKDNLISKLLYWPLILGGLFAISFITFY